MRAEQDILSSLGVGGQQGTGAGTLVFTQVLVPWGQEEGKVTGVLAHVC